MERCIVYGDALKKRFPDREIVVLEEEFRDGIVTKILGYIISQGKFLINHKVGYICGFCNQTYLGMPEISDERISNNPPLTGREGYDVRCHGCTSLMYSSTFKWS